MPRCLLILLDPLAILRRWPDVASSALRSSDRSSIVAGSVSFGLMVTVILWTMGAGLSEPYPTFTAYLQSTRQVPPAFALVFVVAFGLWAALTTLFIRIEPRGDLLRRAAMRLLAASPLQLVLITLAWALLQVLHHVQDPAFGIVDGKPGWLVDAWWIQALGSMWIAIALCSAAAWLLILGLLRFDRAMASANCLWCQYPLAGLSPTSPWPECGRLQASQASNPSPSTGPEDMAATNMVNPDRPACLAASGG